MPALFIFLFKVNIALVLFCLGYYLVLKHLTFYTLNRIYLVIAIVFSTLYPNINLSDFAQHHQQLAQPVQTVISNWKAPAENFVKPLYRPDYWQWVQLVFWAGAILFAVRLMMQLFSLRKLYLNSKPGHIHNYPVRLIGDNISPFSFWRSIYINPASLSAAELKNVLEHEQVHVNQLHTLDILLAELSTIFYWFNPGVWLMKKAVRENIEFITDRNILQKGTDSKQYQYSLVSVGLATTPNTIVNHFNISTIKKRIIMMNAKRSSGYNLTRYVFLVPAVIVLLLVFSFSKAAISKKGMHTFKAITTAITGAQPVNLDKPVLATINKAAVRLASKVKTIKNDTIYAGKSKNGNKSFMVTANTHPDSINYVINGVKASKDELKAVEPGRIESLELLSAKDAKEFFPGLSNDNKVLFVTTEDSETGKKLKEKMDKTFRKGVLVNAKNMTALSLSENSDAAPVAAGSGTSYSVSSSESSDDAPIAMSSSNKDVLTSVIIVKDSKAKAKNLSLKKNITYTITPKASVSINGTEIDPVVVEEVNPDIRVVNVKKINTKTSIKGLGDKLIIIDGKEATKADLKKLSVSDIDSMDMESSNDMKEKYGDKAKNGVLRITTKKAH